MLNLIEFVDYSNELFFQNFPSFRFFQLAPTYREEARALISLMDRYDWNTFSLIIDPRLPGKEELIDEFEAHGNEQRDW